MSGYTSEEWRAKQAADRRHAAEITRRAHPIKVALDAVRGPLVAWADSRSEADADAVERAIEALAQTWRRARGTTEQRTPDPLHG
jgi:hypothetical protein